MFCLSVLFSYAALLSRSCSSLSLLLLPSARPFLPVLLSSSVSTSTAPASSLASSLHDRLYSAALRALVLRRRLETNTNTETDTGTGTGARIETETGTGTETDTAAKQQQQQEYEQLQSDMTYLRDLVTQSTRAITALQSHLQTLASSAVSPSHTADAVPARVYRGDDDDHDDDDTVASLPVGTHADFLEALRQRKQALEDGLGELFVADGQYQEQVRDEKEDRRGEERREEKRKGDVMR